MTVHSYLVTGDAAQRMDAWAPTAGYTNWIEGRERDADRETWLVTCYDEHSVPVPGCGAGGWRHRRADRGRGR